MCRQPEQPAIASSVPEGNGVQRYAGQFPVVVGVGRGVGAGVLVGHKYDLVASGGDAACAHVAARVFDGKGDADLRGSRRKGLTIEREGPRAQRRGRCGGGRGGRSRSGQGVRGYAVHTNEAGAVPDVRRLSRAVSAEGDLLILLVHAGAVTVEGDVNHSICIAQRRYCRGVVSAAYERFEPRAACARRAAVGVAHEEGELSGFASGNDGCYAMPPVFGPRQQRRGGWIRRRGGRRPCDKFSSIRRPAQRVGDREMETAEKMSAAGGILFRSLEEPYPVGRFVAQVEEVAGVLGCEPDRGRLDPHFNGDGGDGCRIGRGLDVAVAVDRVAVIGVVKYSVVLADDPFRREPLGGREGGDAGFGRRRNAPAGGAVGGVSGRIGGQIQAPVVVGEERGVGIVLIGD